jgi:uncharacterized protein YkwD
MNHRDFWPLLILLAGFSAAAAQADALQAVNILREGGCGGSLPPARSLHHAAPLDVAARQWAEGRSLQAAADRSGYRADASAGLHIQGPESSVVEVLKRSSCTTISSRNYRDIGIYRRGEDTWLFLASVYEVPAASKAPVLASRALELVNEARARGTRCGQRSFSPAPPVRLSGTLADVAWGHAVDMAAHDYFEHRDLKGHSPADRVRAVGYKETVVGENIAYGPKSADEVVKGWLDSPGHCENIMDPRFAEMGIAYAPGQSGKKGLFWVQVLAAPRA